MHNVSFPGLFDQCDLQVYLRLITVAQRTALYFNFWEIRSAYNAAQFDKNQHVRKNSKKHAKKEF